MTSTVTDTWPKVERRDDGRRVAEDQRRRDGGRLPGDERPDGGETGPCAQGRGEGQRDVGRQ